jgi:hypothetical protein
MVNLPDVMGVQTVVMIDGHPAIEYAVPDDESESHSREVVKYIEAKRGASFQIRVVIDWTQVPGDHDLAFFVYVDGNYISGTLKQRAEDVGWFNTEGLVTMENGRQFLQGLKFADLSTSEHRLYFDREGNVNHLVPDDANWNSKDPRAKENAEALGTIKVSIWRSRYHGLKKVFSPGTSFDETDTVSEKALKGKALSSRAAYVSVVLLLLLC